MRMQQSAEGLGFDEDVVPLVVLEATRVLLGLTTATEARQTAEDLVHDLGGTLAGPDTDDTWVIPADLSFSEAMPLFAAAPAGSETRARLERHLTSYLLDAHRMLDRRDRAERLTRSASTDSLTGLPNRRMIDRALVAIIDLDHFTSVNDDYGHATGDEVLRTFGGVLRDMARAGDVVGRFGGEEFVAVIDSPDTDADAFLSRLNEAWRRPRPLPVTFSAGVARSVTDPDATIRLADEALYRAKDAGRDLWCYAHGAASVAPVRPTAYVQPYLADR
jgi:diguanylate cyclase (GGDEF)-like protein